MSDNVKRVLLVGTGGMAEKYAEVLAAMNVEWFAVGNRTSSVEKFKENTGKDAIAGGIESYLEKCDDVPEYAIVAVNGEKLYDVSKDLLNAGVSKLLIEKPGALRISEMEELSSMTEKNKAKAYIAYNRRFYASVEAAKRIIDEDGGLLSVNFEFTEWAHVLEKSGNPIEILQTIFLANSTHVVDLVFHMAGVPKEIKTYRSGELQWHKAGSIYSGCGITERNIQFTYQANWVAPGRWGVELLTSEHRLYLRPLEELRIQNKGSVQINKYELDDKVDTDFKAGLYKEVKAFLYGDGVETLCTLEEQKEHMNIYAEISGEEY
jgi:predicted dehydrogenase